MLISARKLVPGLLLAALIGAPLLSSQPPANQGGLKPLPVNLKNLTVEELISRLQVEPERWSDLWNFGCDLAPILWTKKRQT